jgi:hypothetical protein
MSNKGKDSNRSVKKPKKPNPHRVIQQGGNKGQKSGSGNTGGQKKRIANLIKRVLALSLCLINNLSIILINMQIRFIKKDLNYLYIFLFIPI